MSNQLTDDVLRAYAATPDPRVRELLTTLIKHLHAFATETGLTTAEWMAGLEFLTAVGQACHPERQEFILLSDVLGLSSLVETLNGPRGATESTVLGPFYLPGAPHRKLGAPIGRPQDGEPTLIRGQVTDTTGKPLGGATLDVWQCASNGLYDVQDPHQPEFNLRGVFTTGADGRYAFRAVRPGELPRSHRWSGRDDLPAHRPAQLARSARARHRPRAWLTSPLPRTSSTRRTSTTTATRSSASGPR